MMRVLVVRLSIVVIVCFCSSQAVLTQDRTGNVVLVTLDGAHGIVETACWIGNEGSVTVKNPVDSYQILIEISGRDADGHKIGVSGFARKSLTPTDAYKFLALGAENIDFDGMLTAMARGAWEHCDVDNERGAE